MIPPQGRLLDSFFTRQKSRLLSLYYVSDPVVRRRIQQWTRELYCPYTQASGATTAAPPFRALCILQTHRGTNAWKNARCSAWRGVTWNSEQLLLQLTPFRPRERTWLYPWQYVLKTKNDCVRVPQRFVGYATADVGGRHFSGSQGGFEPWKGFGKRKDKQVVRPFLSAWVQ